MMKTATACEGDVCYRCEGRAWARCFICNRVVCEWHAWEATLHARKAWPGYGGNNVDVTHKCVCPDCLLGLIDDQPDSQSGRKE